MFESRRNNFHDNSPLNCWGLKLKRALKLTLVRYTVTVDFAMPRSALGSRTAKLLS